MKRIVLITLIILLPLLAKASTTKTLGDIGRYGIPATAVALTFIKQDKTGFKEFSYALTSSLLITQALKISVNEERPRGDSNSSFPSGHATWAFAGAAFIQRRYGWDLGLPAYFAASYVGYSRLHERAHYVHDVLAGAAIGIAMNVIFTHPYHTKSMQISAVPINHGAALQAKIKL